jgi:acetyl-CoA decarbonylase/synthase complex subunit gamma
MQYKIEPGLFCVGTPGKESPVLVSANYRLSFNALRHALTGRDAWILVLDTKGINVWCAAGKGTFGTAEIVKRVESVNLGDVVTHRTLILPQLGAPGVSAHLVKKQCGWSVKYGPVRASDLPAYLDKNGADLSMRLVTFSFAERFILVPMEVAPAAKNLFLFLIAAAALGGITSEGIIFTRAWQFVAPLVIAGMTALVAGMIVPPLLPFIPGRAFAVKGAITGIAGFAALFFSGAFADANAYILAFCAISTTVFSSYLAFNFTGCTTYTSPSGVKKELRIAWPFYTGAAAVGALLLIIALVTHWGIV